MYLKYIESINERSKGELTLKVLGSSEVIPAFDQGEAVRAGVVDIAIVPAGWYEKIRPGTSAFELSKLSYVEQRKIGFTKVYAELHKTINTVYLGSLAASVPGFYFWTTFKPETPYDLAGKKLRLSGTYVPFYEALGISGINMPLGDLYTALERGVIVGNATTQGVAVRLKTYEVAKYQIDHDWYNPANNLLINMDSWNKLPKHLQDLMEKTMIEMEPAAFEFFTKAGGEDRQTLADNGIEFVKFSPADARWFVDTAYQTRWDNTLRLAPDWGPKLKAATGQ